MVEIKNINKRFNEKQVLSNVSFNMESGIIYGLLGLNGAGKSTLMKIICSLAFADSGSIIIDGRKFAGEKACEWQKDKESIGFMIESPAFYSGLTGRQNLSVLATLYPNVKSNRIDQVLKITGMYEHGNIAVKKYSLGMKQRLYFAYALLNNPKLLILDEPFNGIDPITIKLFRDIIIELAKNGCTILVSSHMISDIKTFCNKIIIIDKGVIKFESIITPNMDLESLFINLVESGGIAQ